MAGNNIDVSSDSGLWCGAYNAKSLASGAILCFSARPYVRGLVMGGQVARVAWFRVAAWGLGAQFALMRTSFAVPESLNSNVLIKEGSMSLIAYIHV